MSTITLHLPADTERALREKAARTGLTVETYLQQVAEREAAGPADRSNDLSADEFERALDDLAAGPPLPSLPADFSRADIYTDHD
jgi:hypothetical protein